MGQAPPHPPQLFASFKKSTHWLPHIEKPPLHPQAPHWHETLQVCEPLASQIWVAPDAHAPWPAHADQADHVPPVHVRVCMPQLPHACDDAPLHVHWPLWQVEPVGQAFPHVPQLPLSVVTSTHEPPQAV
jgi:hypothetical protein